MPIDPLLERARTLWEALAAATVSFPSAGDLTVVASPGSKLCPPSWVGIVVLGSAAIVTVPNDRVVQPVRHALAQVPTESLTRPQTVRAALPVMDVLGPATLGYLSRDDFSPVPTGAAVERLTHGHEDLQELLKSVAPKDADRSGMSEITSPAFVLREGTSIVSTAGYQSWPAATAHLCVLTASAQRGRGLARRVASAAVAEALDADLHPQWRARVSPAESRKVARALGFRELGGQLSIRLDLDRFATLD